MNNPTCFNADEDVIGVSGPLEIYQVDQFKKLFSQELLNRESFTLDLAQITSCDAAGAQLLWALRETVRQEGGSFTIAAASKPLADCWAALGLPADFLEAPEEGQFSRNSYCI